MNFHNYTEKLKTAHSYIEKGWAVTPKQLSEKLAVHERTVLRMISELKEQGVNICYSKALKKYFIKK